MNSKYVSFRVNYVDFYGKKMKSLAYSESTRRKRGLERGDFALVILSLQHSKDKHIGRNTSHVLDSEDEAGDQTCAIKALQM